MIVTIDHIFNNISWGKTENDKFVLPNASSTILISKPTDFAVLMGAEIDKNGCGWYFTRDMSSNTTVKTISAEGIESDRGVFDKRGSIMFYADMNLRMCEELIKRSDLQVTNKDGKTYIQFGRFPQELNLVYSENIERVYENNYSIINSSMETFSFIDPDSSNKIVDYKVFDIKGKQYIRIQNSKILKIGDRIINEGPLWFEIKPISWEILNSSEMPPSINPNGNGSATSIKVVPTNALISGIPFVDQSSDNNSYTTSAIRNYLNSGFINEICRHEINRLNEKLDGAYIDLNGDNDKYVPEGQMSTLERLNPDKTSKSEKRDSTLIDRVGLCCESKKIKRKAFVDQYGNRYEKDVKTGRVVFIIGPPGVGKSFMIDKLYHGRIVTQTIQKGMAPEYIKGGSNSDSGITIPPSVYDMYYMTIDCLVEKKLDELISVLGLSEIEIAKIKRNKIGYKNSNKIQYDKLKNLISERYSNSTNIESINNILEDVEDRLYLKVRLERARIYTVNPSARVKNNDEEIENAFEVMDEIYTYTEIEDLPTCIYHVEEFLNAPKDVQSWLGDVFNDQNRKFDIGHNIKVPCNFTVVATGNPANTSDAAYAMASILASRDAMRIDIDNMTPKKWIEEYAKNNGIHPAVIGYIEEKYNSTKDHDKPENMVYFLEIIPSDPKARKEFFADKGIEVGDGLSYSDKEIEMSNLYIPNNPRNWEIVSDNIYSFERDLANGKFTGWKQEAIDDYFKRNILKLKNSEKESFFDFYNTPVVSLNDVINDCIDISDIPQEKDKDKFIRKSHAIVRSFLAVDEEYVHKCLIFINKYLKPEFLSLFESLWANGNEKRKELLAQIHAIGLENFDKFIKGEENV